MEEIKNKKILIVGMGKEGIASAYFLRSANLVFLFDQKAKEELDWQILKKLKHKNVTFFLNGKLPQELRFDLIIRSPGVRPDLPLITRFLKQGSILTSQTKIFFDLCPCPIIGVTGTKGKGTTSTLITKMLATKYKSVYLAGNIGTPALSILPRLTKSSLVVLELSSFQLFDLKKSPHVGVVLMITQEHLDWHTDKKEYIKAKETIIAFQNPNDYAIINYDYKNSQAFAKETKAKVFFFSTQKATNGIYLDKDLIVSAIGPKVEIVSSIKNVLLPGKHNLQNILAAVAVSKIYNVKNTGIVKVLKNFKGLKHRLQFIRQIRRVSFYNDSYSTIPETAIAAIEAFDKPKILILGGSSKNSDFSKLGEKISQDVSIKSLVLIGQEAKRIKLAIEDAGGFKGKISEGAKSMKEAVNLAKFGAKKGDVIILSPACASFDMFKNYEDRGEQFIKEVKSQKAQ